MPTPVNPPPARIIDLGENLRGPLQRALYNMVRSPVESFLAVDSFNALYRDVHSQTPEENFFIRTLRTLEVGYAVSAEDIARIPRTGPLIVVANHPFGGLDGLALAALISSLRNDVRMISNFMLLRVPELRPWIFPVDPFHQSGSARQNLQGMKDAIKHLRAGGCINTFPSGTVSHLRLSERQVTDPAWNTHVARLARAAAATVLPVYFDGNNSALFQLLGLVHPRLRTAMLPRELMRQRAHTLSLRIGQPIPFARLDVFPTDEAMTEFLRLSTYLLRNRGGKAARQRFPVPLNLSFPRKPQRKMADIAPAVPPEDLAQDFANLPKSQILLEHASFAVAYAYAEQIPFIMLEIARLREVTFR
ncbi:MAG TPA: lysophospholipid acyltransferase family protein, partial [Opitutales bacterium]|nr:lysophospholipid acyltransferase family protein [Opitutales bacterium]